MSATRADYESRFSIVHRYRRPLSFTEETGKWGRTADVPYLLDKQSVGNVESHELLTKPHKVEG